MRLELAGRHAGGLKLGDCLAAAYLGFVCQRGGFGSGFEFGVARRLPQGNRFGLGLLGVGFGFIGFSLLALGGVAGGLKLGTGLLLGNLRLALLAHRRVIGNGFDAERLLRVEIGGRTLGVDGEQRGGNSGGLCEPFRKKGNRLRIAPAADRPWCFPLRRCTIKVSRKPGLALTAAVVCALCVY